MEPILKLRGVGYRTPAGQELLADISFTVQAGEVVQLAGPSGSGKSTLLRLLNRLGEAAGGEIEVLGRPLDAWPVRELRRRVALVFQAPELVERRVDAALRLPARIWKAAPPSDGDLEKLLETAGLAGDYLRRDCADLSGGEAQRVAIARALAAGPEVLLLDEPTSALDEAAARPLLENLKAWCAAEGATLVLSNHRLAEVRSLGGRLLVLVGGRLCAEGEVAALFRQPPAGAVAAFLRGGEVAPGEGT